MRQSRHALFEVYATNAIVIHRETTETVVPKQVTIGFDCSGNHIAIQKFDFELRFWVRQRMIIGVKNFET